MKQNPFIHIILFSFFPIISLYFVNIHILKPSSIILPTIIVISFSIGLFFLLKLILKSRWKSAIIVSLIIISFFMYGHFFNIIEDYEDGMKSEFFVTAYLIFFGVIFLLIIKTKKKLNNINQLFNIFSISIIIVMGLGILNYYVQISFIEYDDEALIETEIIKNPSIYYILLDGYASADVLINYRNFDNSEFIKFLEEKGFFIPQENHSNYARTFLSVTSILNMKYINYLSEELGIKSKDQQIPYAMINNNLVMKNLKEMNYKIISFNSGWWGTNNIELADENRCSKNTIIDYAFFNMLKKISIVSALGEFPNKTAGNISSDYKREKILCQFSELIQIKNTEQGPVFVFAHIVAPHGPHVFGANGERISSEYSKEEAYIAQMKFVNLKMYEIINNLTKDEENVPIIIIQSDHGIGLKEREHYKLKNFNAYLLPDKSKFLYDEITPVNTFRVIFKSYFNEEYNLVEDRSFWSTTNFPYNFTDVTEELKSKLKN